jgi:gluconate kinase
LGRRQAHFFPKGLLESQFAVLERPGNTLIVDANRSIEEIIEQIVAAENVLKSPIHFTAPEATNLLRN